MRGLGALSVADLIKSAGYSSAGVDSNSWQCQGPVPPSAPGIANLNPHPPIRCAGLEDPTQHSFRSKPVASCQFDFTTESFELKTLLTRKQLASKQYQNFMRQCLVMRS